MKVLTKVMIGSLLFLESAKAMNEEETSHLPRTYSIQSHPPKTQSSSLTTSFESLPNTLVRYIFKFLDVNDLGRTAQVSTRWEKITESPNLWKYMGLKYYGDFLNEEDLKENPKQKIISHYLSVIVNAIEDLKQIENIVSRYQLGTYFPLFKEYVGDIYKGGKSFLINLVRDLRLHEVFITQGNKEAIKKKMEGLLEGKYGYEKNLVTAREFNEWLIEKGDREAISRKIGGLRYGHRPYKQNPIAVREFNERLIEKGDLEAINRKIEGFLKGQDGYEKNLITARNLNEWLIEKGDPEAINRKIDGFLQGINGYEKNLTAAGEFIELYVKKGDIKVLEKKFHSLAKKGS